MGVKPIVRRILTEDREETQSKEYFKEIGKRLSCFPHDFHSKRVRIGSGIRYSG